MKKKTHKAMSAEIQSHIEAADKIALSIVEEKAREILRKHPNLHEFVMGMGTWFFVDKNNTILRFRDLAYLKSLDDFIGDWEEVLCITGNSMRFTAEGPMVTQW